MDIKTFNGDSLEILKKLEDNSVDLTLTDPPYGYSFMGKQWDKALPNIEIWKECYRVMKPGSFIFVMSAPRSDVQSRMSIDLENAGFVTSFTPIFWVYSSGLTRV
jgi:site-specific DNA-methyltransferase (adenine-specific)